MQIVSIRNSGDVDVKFLDGTDYMTKSTLQNFRERKIQNPLHKSAYGVGYLGIGQHRTSSADRNLSIEYDLWRAMIKRCYSLNAKDRYPAYYGICTVCEEWHNFQIFAEWYNKNIYYVPNERMHIDKDVIEESNTVYSPETCIILPQKINMIFVKRQNKQQLPSGISRLKSNLYIATYIHKKLGVFNTLEEAIIAHDIEKQKHLRELTIKYGDLLPDHISNILMEWTPKSLK